MTAVKSGLMVIDQHRAHVRILYERYMNKDTANVLPTQKVLFPEVVQLPPSQQVIMEHVLPEMQRIGFDIVALGGGSYGVNGIPAGIEGLQITALVQQMVAEAAEQGSVNSTDIGHAIADCLARNAAIPVGQVLNNDEMDDIVNNLFQCTNVNYTPDGKVILNILKHDDIEVLFR